MENQSSAAIIPPETRRLIWAAVACWLAIHVGPSFLSQLRVTPLSGQAYPVPDFFADFASARNFLLGRDIYTPHARTLSLYFDKSNPSLPTFQYNVPPPSSVLLALPLARLDFSFAFLVWDLLSLGFVIMSLWLIKRELNVATTPWLIFPTISILLLCHPLWDQMRMGQSSALLLLLLTGAWAAQRSGRPILSGALLAGAASRASANSW